MSWVPFQVAGTLSKRVSVRRVSIPHSTYHVPCHHVTYLVTYHVTLGTVAKPSLIADGCTLLSAFSKSDKSICSKLID
jgi:hypothetical protein